MAPKAAKTEKKTKASAEKGGKGKRTPSPYILFCKEKRPELKATHPSATFGEMGKMLGQLWSQMDEKAKAVSDRNFLNWLLTRLIASVFLFQVYTKKD